MRIKGGRRLDRVLICVTHGPFANLTHTRSGTQLCTCPSLADKSQVGQVYQEDAVSSLEHLYERLGTQGCWSDSVSWW